MLSGMALRIFLVFTVLCVEIHRLSVKGTNISPASKEASSNQNKTASVSAVVISGRNDTVAENATKRGFLANLAALLNDAEEMSKKIPESTSDNRTGAAMSSILRKDSASHIVPGSNEHDLGNTSSDSTPSVSQLESTLLEEGKRFAPIFAYFHGKIVPLGRLPATSFHKSHEDELPDGAVVSQLPEEKISQAPMEDKARTVSASISSSTKSDVETPSVVDNKEKEIPAVLPEVSHKPVTNVVKVSDKPNETETVPRSLRVLSPRKYERLSKFFKTLEEHSKTTPRTLKTRNVAGVTKDEVTFPDDSPAVRTNDIMTHVKALLLDNGKVLHVPEKAVSSPLQPSTQENAKVKSSDTEGNGEESSEKYFVSEDGSLTPMFRAKETETQQASTRDIGEAEHGDKTITVSIDMLKDLLKKADSKESLAQLLNAKTKAETNAETQEEDPGTIEDFAAGGLKKHNEYRAEHHAPTLVWSDELANEAQKLAEELADKKALEISKDLEKKGYGENVAKVWANFKCAGEAATKMWYTQSANYRYYDPQLDENTGQFAQVVWKDTKELGMGVAKSIDDVNNKYVYVVALYRPPGNIEATLRDNVIPTGNNTVDVYSTFFKRSGKLRASRRSKVPKSVLLT